MINTLTEKQVLNLEEGSSCKSIVYRSLKEHGELSLEQVMDITKLPYTNAKQGINELTNGFCIAERIPAKYKLKQ